MYIKYCENLHYSFYSYYVIKILIFIRNGIHFILSENCLLVYYRYFTDDNFIQNSIGIMRYLLSSIRLKNISQVILTNELQRRRNVLLEFHNYMLFKVKSVSQ